MKKTLLSGLVLGASLVGGVASADAPYIAHFPYHNDMRAGTLWRDDQPHNNDQRGAGDEHQSMVFLPGENRILVFGTSSYTDITPGINPVDGSATPGPALGLSSQAAGVLDPTDADANGIGVRTGGDANHRVEGLCRAYSLDPQKGLVLQNTAYVTDNDSPDWQNAHKMLATNIDDHAAAIYYGYDPNGQNTATYSTAIGPNCERVSAQTLIIAKTNDNVGGLYTAHIRNVISPTQTQIVGGVIGNGNGRDNGWVFSSTWTKTGQTGQAAYTVVKDFDQTVVQDEERSRGTIRRIAGDPNHLLVIYAEGNNQPPDEAVRISKVNIDRNFTGQADPNNAAGGRVEFRQTLMARQGNIYYTTPDLVEVMDAQGNPTDKYIANWVQVNTANRNGRQKGRTAIQSVPLQLTATGLTMLDQPKEGLFGIADGAHPGFIQGNYGNDHRSVAFMMSGNITDGAGAAMKIIGTDSTGKLEAVRALNWADYSSGGYSSQWYGHNPNTPQGRTYPAQGIMVANPGYGVTGGFQPTVKTFMVLAHAHHLDHTGQCGPSDPTPADPNKGTNNGTCGGKNASSIVMIPVEADDTSDPNQGNDPTQGENPPQPDQPVATGGQTLGGCSTTGAGGLGSLLLVGMALTIVRRRRSK